ncbi:hypothetical protein HDU67_009669 [Dinochytrium kinnereticum]|nr:hypothetical protein HDU67_009669 [Dinochytrium kinnereticum]
MSAVQVVLRVKPPVPSVKGVEPDLRRTCLRCHDNSIIIQKEAAECILAWNMSGISLRKLQNVTGMRKEDIYNERCSDLIKEFVDGTNVTILA